MITPMQLWALKAHMDTKVYVPRSVTSKALWLAAYNRNLDKARKMLASGYGFGGMFFGSWSGTGSSAQNLPRILEGEPGEKPGYIFINEI